METKFDKLYNVIMEDLNANEEDQLHGYAKWYLTGGNTHRAPYGENLIDIYNRYKDIIHKYEDLSLAVLQNANTPLYIKKEFKDSPFEEVQEWLEENEPYSPDSLSDEDEEYYRDFTQGEGYPWL